MEDKGWDQSQNSPFNRENKSFPNTLSQFGPSLSTCVGKVNSVLTA